MTVEAQTLRPRYGRLCAAVSAFLVTLVSLIGGLGLLGGNASAAATPQRAVDTASVVSGQVSGHGSGHGSGHVATTPGRTPQTAAPVVPTPSADTALPAASGSGKRVVFDMSEQRVWLVARGDRVRRTYLVSGSLTDNLHPGTYAVYSTSRWATGIEDSGVMEYFVRFTRGDNAAIGFHSIPTKNGTALQTRAQLGAPQSHGCIRQWLPDAKRLWDFAPVGTKVVVTA